MDEVFHQWATNGVSAWKIPLLYTILDLGTVLREALDPVDAGVAARLHAREGRRRGRRSSSARSTSRARASETRRTCSRSTTQRSPTGSRRSSTASAHGIHARPHQPRVRVEDDRPAAETSCMRTAAVATVLAAVVATSAALATPPPGAATCRVFPADNAWNRRVDTLPVLPGSAATIAAIGPTKTMHADFGSGLWDGGPIGIPITIVTKAQRKSTVRFDYADESDRGPYRSRPASRSRAAPRPTVTGMHSFSTATRAASTSCSPSAAPATAGRRDPARSGISARTGCVPPVGHPPTRQGFRSRPVSRATTRSRKDGSTTRCASRSRGRNGHTSRRRGTMRAR